MAKKNAKSQTETPEARNERVKREKERAATESLEMLNLLAGQAVLGLCNCWIGTVKNECFDHATQAISSMLPPGVYVQARCPRQSNSLFELSITIDTDSLAKRESYAEWSGDYTRSSSVHRVLDEWRKFMFGTPTLSIDQKNQIISFVSSIILAEIRGILRCTAQFAQLKQERDSAVALADKMRGELRTQRFIPLGGLYGL